MTAGPGRPDVEVVEVDAHRAHDVLALIHASFAGRPVLDPPSTALEETVDSVTRTLAQYGGLLAVHAGRPVGALLLGEEDGLLGLHRVGVLAEARRHGVASALARAAEEVARSRGLRGLELEARRELPETVRFWEGHGYVETAHVGPRLTMTRLLPLAASLPEAEDTRAVGERLGGLLRAGDLVILTGDLGAGKTTLTQGLGQGLGVRGNVTSPTFVISRVHPSEVGGPPLVHVDAYRLSGAAELDDLDLDTDVDEAVTVVEWGEGLAEALTGDRLEIRLERPADPSSEVRSITVTAVGSRWRDADLTVVLPVDAD
jgi:tRNA threonylcarbamoyladenosine biosynthesis protein TsaE